MAERPECYRCGKDAIGFQSIACSDLHVCGKHADSRIIALRPGEKQSCGESFSFERFSTGDP